MRRRRLILAGLILVAGVAITQPHGPETAAGQTPSGRVVPLEACWNLVSWTGPETPIEEALAAISAQVLSAHTFDNDAKQFRHFSATALPSSTA